MIHRSVRCHTDGTFLFDVLTLFHRLLCLPAELANAGRVRGRPAQVASELEANADPAS